MTRPHYASHSSGNCTPLDKIVERKGPYIKFWIRTITYIEPYLTKRDITHVSEGRALIYRTDGDNVRVLAVVEGKPKWKRATISTMRLFDENEKELT